MGMIWDLRLLGCLWKGRHLRHNGIRHLAEGLEVGYVLCRCTGWGCGGGRGTGAY